MQQQTVFVPIGIDCGMAELLRNHNWRSCSFPFDWSMTYGGVADIFANDFAGFIPAPGATVNAYQMTFPHDSFPQDAEKLARRIDRLIQLMKHDDIRVIFIRKGHDAHNHRECENIKDEMEDAMQLSQWLATKYPKLQFKVITTLICSKCHGQKIQIIKENNEPNMEIHDLSDCSGNDARIFERLHQICQRYAAAQAKE